ncbi:topoisomerase DNA-binding C4 zinc finger domain-containing protein, partial [Thermodesulfobacteriota bacterium]
ELTKKVSKRFKKAFYSCNKYPKCKFILNYKPFPETCPLCKAPYLLEKSTKAKGKFIACNTKDCDYTKPIDEE